MSRAEESQCDLLAILLQFDPYKRPTAHQALSRFAESIRSSIQGHAYLDDLHDEDAPRVTFWVSELRMSHWPKAMWTGASMRRCRPRAFSALGAPRKSLAEEKAVPRSCHGGGPSARPRGTPRQGLAAELGRRLVRPKMPRIQKRWPSTEVFWWPQESC